MEWKNGFSTGIAHARSPAKSAAPLSDRSAAHTARVLEYFKARGLPPDQIGAPAVTTLMRRTGTTSGTELSRTLVGFTTVLPRLLDGVVVADSHAWARFNKDDSVVAEEVWWPALPGTVRDEVAAFREVLSDQTSAAAFKQRLPPELRALDGSLRVHHALPSGEHWYLEVTLDFAKRGDNNVISVNRSGTIVRLVSTDDPPSDTRGVVPTGARPGPGLGNGTGPRSTLRRGQP